MDIIIRIHIYIHSFNFIGHFGAMRPGLEIVMGEHNMNLN